MKLFRTRWPMIVIVLVILAIGLLLSDPPETPLQRTYRICKECGLYEPEIDQLIENYRVSGIPAKIAIEVWKQTAEPDATQLCLPCVEAVVEVTGDVK